MWDNNYTEFVCSFNIMEKKATETFSNPPTKHCIA